MIIPQHKLRVANKFLKNKLKPRWTEQNEMELQGSYNRLVRVMEATPKKFGKRKAQECTEDKILEETK